MPELPDLEYVVPKLKEALVGRTVVGCDLANPVVLRQHVHGNGRDLGDYLGGAAFRDVRRHGPFVHLDLESIAIVVHPMLAGQFYLQEPPARLPRTAALSLMLDSPPNLVYADSKQMGRVYVVRPDGLDEIQGYVTQGVNVLSEGFTWEYFQESAAGTHKQARVFLMDQSRISAIGNAYADEILYAACIHPKHPMHKLDDGQLRRLFDSIRGTLKWGMDEVRRAAKPIHEKHRDHLRVRNRKNAPCPECRTPIRRTTVYGYDSFFCPRCQPEFGRARIPW